ncbi:hypothetical protein AB0368_10545 [Actinoplanes sp. NPDC051475]|uniref:hypothetical protein n=1 Tax=Actinoplanes sp. NPDC051475 TaxID=3157225 RepID=UPI00344B6025
MGAGKPYEAPTVGRDALAAGPTPPNRRQAAHAKSRRPQAAVDASPDKTPSTAKPKL